MSGSWPVLLAAAFGAGAINAVAGGGSFLTLPALIYAGVPPVAANATGTVALLPGYAGSCMAFRREITANGSSPFVPALVCLAGGGVGAALLMVTSNQAFSLIVPWLLLFATLLFAFGPFVRRRLGSEGARRSLPMLGSLLVVSVYGGYFNGGLGIMLLAQLSFAGLSDLNIMNGLKNLFSTLLTAIAVAVYAVGGAVVWPLALGMAGAAVCGGYVGGQLGRKVPPMWLRNAIILTGLATTVSFFLR